MLDYVFLTIHVDVSSIVHQNISSINNNGTEEPHSSKRTASEAFQDISTSQGKLCINKLRITRSSVLNMSVINEPFSHCCMQMYRL